MSISARIKQLAFLEGTQVDFATKTGILPPTISRMIRVDGNTRSDNIALIAKAYPNLNLRWLILGEGEMWTDEDCSIQIDEEKEALKDEILELQKSQIQQLKREIRRACPGLARELELD